VFNTNVRGLYFTAQAVAKLMVENIIKGRIVNTSSVAGGEVIQQGMAIYSASKAAVIQLTRWATFPATMATVGPVRKYACEAQAH
jgi:NAD(P)-dependent dehydrogenase (short-subunit alcohol dehydrogenase family)